MYKLVSKKEIIFQYRGTLSIDNIIQNSKNHHYIGMGKFDYEYNKIISILPMELKIELSDLIKKRDNPEISAKDWHRDAKSLMLKARKYPKAVKHNFIRAIKLVASEEREVEKK